MTIQPAGMTASARTYSLPKADSPVRFGEDFPPERYNDNCQSAAYRQTLRYMLSIEADTSERVQFVSAELGLDPCKFGDLNLLLSLNNLLPDGFVGLSKAERQLALQRALHQELGMIKARYQKSQDQLAAEGKVPDEQGLIHEGQGLYRIPTYRLLKPKIEQIEALLAEKGWQDPPPPKPPYEPPVRRLLRQVWQQVVARFKAAE